MHIDVYRRRERLAPATVWVAMKCPENKQRWHRRFPKLWLGIFPFILITIFIMRGVPEQEKQSNTLRDNDLRPPVKTQAGSLTRAARKHSR